MSFNEENPWTKVSTKEIYSNPWIKVQEDQVIRPSGNKGIYGKVLFQNKAIGIVPLDEHNHTWLVGQYRYTLEEYSWEIPMGGGALDVPLLESAQRELKEETGISAKKWNNIMRIHTSNSVTNEEGFVFLAQDLSYGETEFEETEVLSIKRVSIEKALSMVMNNEITDSISVAGLLKVALMLGIGYSIES